MYAWIWRKLPGSRAAKLAQSAGLAVAIVALLWYVVFPWATPLLPFDDVQVSDGSQSGPAQQDPNAVIPSADDVLPYPTNINNPAPTPSRNR